MKPDVLLSKGCYLFSEGSNGSLTRPIVHILSEPIKGPLGELSVLFRSNLGRTHSK